MVILNEFGQAYNNLDKTIHDMMEKKEATTIRQILEVMKHVNKKNTPYPIYRVREFIRNAGIEALKKITPQIKVEEIQQEESQMTESDMEKIK
jgi:citrate lyase synthetase